MEEPLRELRDEVKRCLDYREFYRRYCHADRRTNGNRWQALCPIPSHNHSGKGHPSLSVDLARGLFHCFSRNEGGDAIRFYELMHGVSFRRAVQELARELGISRATARQPALSLLARRAAPDPDGVENQHAEPLGANRISVLCEAFLRACRDEEQTEGRNYLARRGINNQTAERLGIAYFPPLAYRRVMRRLLDNFPLEELQQSGLFNSRQHLTFYRHRLLFPFYLHNRVVYLQARAIAKTVTPRWHNLRGQVPCLYNSDALREMVSDSVVYLVEGFTDTLTLVAHGFSAVGIAGAGGFREEWIAELARFRVVAVLDPDAAGQRAARRYAELFANRGVEFAQLELPTDVNDFFCRHASAALELTLLSEAALEDSVKTKQLATNQNQLSS